MLLIFDEKTPNLARKIYFDENYTMSQPKIQPLIQNIEISEKCLLNKLVLNYTIHTIDRYTAVFNSGNESDIQRPVETVEDRTSHWQSSHPLNDRTRK